jgi:uncharacterized protein YigA (DUF484 family)
MKADNVAEYLQQNPDFFAEHAELLTDLVLPHPHGGRTISLSERQMLVLRERVKDLEKKLYDWMLIARENEALQDKVHQYTLALLGARDLATLQSCATRNLLEIFSVPHAVMHLWAEQPPSAEVIAFAEQHGKPVCAHKAVYDTELWFGESAEHLRSFAYLPLRSETQSIGLLILASEDAQRFYPEMGTVFLQRIAEMASKAVQALQ